LRHFGLLVDAPYYWGGEEPLPDGGYAGVAPEPGLARDPVELFMPRSFGLLAAGPGAVVFVSMSELVSVVVLPGADVLYFCVCVVCFL
jgi:hypothetical protein